MKYVLFYESGDDVATNAPPHFPAHSARLQEFHARGDLLMVGTFGARRTKGRWRSSPAVRRRRSSRKTTRSS